MKYEDLPKEIPVFPLSNFIIFPKTTVPLNIFEPRYIDMINDSMKSHKLIGMIQPKNLKESIKINIRSVQKVGKVWISREKTPGPIWGQFFDGPETCKNCMCFGPWN